MNAQTLPAGVHQPAAVEAKRGAVGEHLVNVGVRDDRDLTIFNSGGYRVW